MNISAEKLAAEAASTGFRQDFLEKVAYLLELLKLLQSHPFLKGKLALKGGTALNLFVFKVPRLSVDIDLNYVGASSREGMIDDRPKIEQAIQAVFKREGFSVRRMPDEHAGGKWSLRYKRASGQGGNIEVDVNFMYRVPLWPVAIMNSHRLGAWQATGIPVVGISELSAGKLAALLSRRKARDLFDSNQILKMEGLNLAHLRIAFVVYGAMNRKDWRTVCLDDVVFDESELESQLLPTLRAHTIGRNDGAASYGEKLVTNCREALSAVLPLNANELDFLNLLLDKGEIRPSLLTSDETLQRRINEQPLLQWKALNVRKYRGIS
jgi:hypothetical protein